MPEPTFSHQPDEAEDERHFSASVFCDCWRCEVPWDEEEDVLAFTTPPLTARLIDIARIR